MPQVVDVLHLNFDEFQKKFTEERTTVSNDIQEYIRRLADIKEYVNCELFFHSERQKLLDSIHKYMDMTVLLQNSLDIRKSNALNSIVNEASSNFNFKSKDEKLILIDGNNEIAITKQFIELFNNHVLFLNESKKTIEGIIYNMKYRIEIQKQLDVC